MKKITLLISMMFISLGYSQTFPLDFSDPLDLMAGYDGCVVSIVSDAGNQVLQVVGGGQLYDTAQLNLNGNLNLADNANNTITFRVKPTTGTGNGSHLLKFEGGVGGAPQVELAFTTTGTAWQNISLDFGAGLGNYSKVVLFTDFNNTLTGTYLFDDFAGGTNLAPPPPPAQPTTAAPNPPARPTADVKSIFSNAYAPISTIGYSGSGDDNTYDTSWCGATTTLVSIVGNATNRVAGLGCEGVAFLAGRFDATSFTNFHMDIWTETPTLDKSFNVKFSNWNGGASESNAIQYSFTNANFLPSTNPGTWISLDIPLSSFTTANGGLNRNDLAQFVISSDLGIVFYDNLYLHKNTLGVAGFEVSKFKMYPNPASSELTIQNQSTIDSISIINMLGQEMFKKSTSNTIETIDVSGLNSGVYFIKITSLGVSATERFIKS